MKHRHVKIALYLCLFSLIGCGVNTSGNFEITEVDPSSTYLRNNQTINIIGEGFNPLVQQNVGCGAGEYTVDYQYQVRIAPNGNAQREWIDLDDITWEGENHISGTLTANSTDPLPTGMYDLMLISPTGESLLKENAVTIKSGVPPDTERDTDTAMDSNTNLDTDSATDSDSNLDTESATDSDSNLDTNTATDSDLNLDTDTATDSDSNLDTESDTDADSETDSDTGIDYGCDGNNNCYGSCWNCATAGPCSTEEFVCNNQPHCLNAFTCINGCTGDHEQWQICYDNCLYAHPLGANLVYDLRKCVMCKVCPNDCAGDMVCPTDTPETSAVYYTNQIPNLNGQLENLWNPHIPIDKTLDGLVSENSAMFDVMWSNTHLYIGVTVIDDKPLYEDSTDLFDDDTIEIFIDPDNSKTQMYDTGDIHITVVAISDTMIFYPGVISNVDVNLGPTFGGYDMELYIPWSSLGITPSVGYTFGFEIYVDDDDDGGTRDGLLGWQGETEAWHDTTNLGQLTLSGTTVN